MTAVLHDWQVDNLETVSVFVRHYRVVPTLLAAAAITNTSLAGEVRRFWSSNSQCLGHGDRLEMPPWVEGALIERDGPGCQNPYCPEHRHRGRREIDHRMAVYCSGSDQLTNLHLLCPACNGRKSVLFWDEFLKREERRAA